MLIFSTFSGITSTAYMMVLNFLKSTRPSLLIRRAALGNLKASFHCTHWHRFFPLKKAFFESLRLPFQRELHILTKPSLLRKEGCNRPTRCSEPLRSKVVGPSKVFAMVVRDGTAWRKNQVLRTASHQWKITLFII